MGFYLNSRANEFDSLHEEVMDFIKGFTALHPKEIIDIFVGGYCYWFAYILEQRFKYANPFIMYDDIRGHFMCKIGTRCYDITGVIRDDARDVKLKYWTDFEHENPELAEGIIKDCILKIPRKEEN